jgi:hypothetical protein
MDKAPAAIVEEVGARSKAHLCALSQSSKRSVYLASSGALAFRSLKVSVLARLACIKEVNAIHKQPSSASLA